MTFSLTIKRVTAALLAPAFILCLLAATQPLRAETTSRPALWKLEDADSEIWLFGTIHILDPEIQWRDESISNAFENADTLITEAPVHDPDPKAMQALITQYGVNRSGESFIEKLSPEGRAYFEKAVMSVGMPAEGIHQFAPYRPWLAGVTVQVMQMQALGANPEAGVDKLLWREAKTKGKRLDYFETAEEQMQVFGHLKPADELHFFEEGMRQLVEEPDLLDQIVMLWQSGDVEGLGEKMQAAMIGQQALYDALLTNRNENWAEQINALMAGEGKIFIAVGAAHLAGENSVQTLLETRYGLKAKRQ